MCKGESIYLKECGNKTHSKTELLFNGFAEPLFLSELPQPSKRKGRVVKSASKSYKTTYIVVAIVAAIIIGAAGYYVYASLKSTTTVDATTANGISTSSGVLYAKISTSQGTIEVELFQSLVPTTVNNFVSLVNSGFYTNLVWHRIVKGFVIQTGDPTSKNGQGNPCSWGSTSSPSTVTTEIVPSLHNDQGYLGIARTQNPDSGSSQFYINLANNTSLDGQYTVFGKVIGSGLSVAQAIGNLPVTTCSGGGTPPQTPSQAMVYSITMISSP